MVTKHMGVSRIYVALVALLMLTACGIRLTPPEPFTPYPQDLETDIDELLETMDEFCR